MPWTLLLAAVMAAPQARVSPDRLYYGIGNPVTVQVEVADGAAVALALLEADGTLLAPPRTVQPGRVDVGALVPECLKLPATGRACYLQCIVDGEPAGSALVMEPMLSRLAPRTEQAQRPDGTPYTRIIGWGPVPQPDDKPQRFFSGLRVYPERDVVLHTTLGDIVVAMRPDEAPNTAWNFMRLADGGFYDGVVFHRVVPLTRQGHPFVIQGGDPTGTGEGEPGYWLPIEPSELPHEFGVISMARADDPDSAGSQFFFCLSRAGTARLDGQYCAFGEAVDGARAIRAIAEVELADVATGRPAEPPVILKATLVPAPPRIPGEGRPDRPLAEKRPHPPVETQPDRVPR
jgi:peptidyl-prolyl cis-trans isomerase B (cyclophilin B)